MATQVILLERVESLGAMGDVVSVKPGYARNYLLPQKKALRASKDNIAYFEAQKKTLQTDNDNKRKDAEKRSKKVEGSIVPLIRQASEAGQLFGSVTSRDIAESLSQVTGEKVDRTMVQMNQNFKLLGLFPVDVALHPEVKVSITINIARSKEEAETQAKTGKALIAGNEEEDTRKKPANVEADLSSVLEDGALQAENDKREAEESEKASEE